MTTEPAYRQFTVHDYHRMADIGILREDDRVELIDGKVVEMSPIGGRHVTCVSRINRLLVSRLTDDAIVNGQSPVRLGKYQEPEPDLAVVRNREYGNELPNADDVFLLMEVSDSSLAYDRGTKLRLYARAGIPEFWLIDLPGEAIERHTNPSGDQYGVTVRVGRGAEIESTRVPGLLIRTDDVLGKQ
ncbi:MAG: Uma2 family endonuclease [Chloroflexota bacterium]|nr:Uma2 family endonuclease [Chloroflexota bacterium]